MFHGTQLRSQTRRNNMDVVEFAESVKGLKLSNYQKKYLTGMDYMKDDRCKECKLDWTKCSKCPVMIEWVKEHKKESEVKNDKRRNA